MSIEIQNKTQRQIKFRAWDKKLKIFREHFNLSWDGMILFEDSIDSDNFVLMQYTGLQDRNGKGCFEGDIVKVHKFTQELGENMGVTEGEKEFVAKVEFSMYGGIYLEAGENDSGPLYEYENGFHEESIEIIGNIYQNAELLTP